MSPANVFRPKGMKGDGYLAARPVVIHPRRQQRDDPPLLRRRHGLPGRVQPRQRSRRLRLVQTLLLHRFPLRPQTRNPLLDLADTLLQLGQTRYDPAVGFARPDVSQQLSHFALPTQQVTLQRTALALQFGPAGVVLAADLVQHLVQQLRIAAHLTDLPQDQGD